MEQMHQAFCNGLPPGMPYYPPALPPPMPPQFAQHPPGLIALYSACSSIYPNQVNPLQVSAVTKYWFGGPDPLDFISMYSNPGDPEQDIPPHWHYVSFGMSDLHGDGRVHQITTPDLPSGFGFELTFRLKREENDQGPPTWPAAVMQSLAKYVFQSENTLCPGDHVSWQCSLDNSDSRIQHMVMTEDPQLGTVMTPFGSVTFIQIIGVCVEELQAAQQWNGPGLIDLMKSVQGAGGPWLVTDMRRGETIFEIDPDVRMAVDDGISAEGSNLSGVTAKCSWAESRDKAESSSESDNSSPKNKILTAGHEDEGDKTRGALSPNLASRASRHSSMSVERRPDQNEQSSSRMSCTQPFELMETKFINSVHVTLNADAGTLLPLVLKGRLKHGRHFTFRTFTENLAITFCTEAVNGSFVDKENPYGLKGPWLQILIPSEDLDSVVDELSELQNTSDLELPKTYEFREQKLSFTIVPEEIDN